MHEILVFCTCHINNNNCSSDILLQYLHHLKPDVIFEELSVAMFVKAYANRRFVSLESNAIKDYLRFNSAIHIPVDTYPRPENYEENIDRLNDRVYNCHWLPESLDLYILDQLINKKGGEKGFQHLNTQENVDEIEAHTKLKQKILALLGDQELIEIFKVHLETIHNREYEIIKNVYNYCIDNNFETGVLFIGSAHRNTIWDKIQELEDTQKIKLNWDRA